MSGAVDTKTVEMRFDNQNFESNAKQSISTLEKLKSALKLDGASKGLSDIEKASKKLDFKEVDRGLENFGHKFNWLEAIATGALYRIGMKAVDAGEKLVKSLTIDQLTAGWSKYESKTTSVQTIMANLRDTTGEFVDEAAKMDYVTERIEKLNWFADETSYSLTDMTSTVGKLVAQGVDLDSSVQAAMGISNLAAISGQTAAEANRVMYNVAQAMGTGAMKALDWKSLENANMATAELRQTAIEIAQDKGKIKEGQVTIENFRDSLASGWFDKEVMMATFEEYGSAIDKVQAKIDEVAENNDGLEITASKALKMLAAEDDQFAKSLGYRAFKAAQEAKTFHEALNATSDAVSSKWMSVFENIFGNYLQQRELWTDLANDLWDVFAAPVDRLSSIFKAWNQGIDGISGRTHLIEGFKNIFNTLVHSVMDDETGEIKRYSIFDTIKNGFKEVFGLDKEADALGKSLWNLTKRFKEFTEKLIPTDTTLEKIKNSFKGLFTLFKIGGKLVSAVVKPFKDLFGKVFKNSLSGVLDLADGFGSLIQNFDKFLEENKVFDAISNGISWGLQKIGEGLDFVSQMLAGVSFKEFFGNLKTKVGSFFTNLDFSGVGSTFSSIISQIKQVRTEDLPEKLTPLQNFYIGITNIFSGMKKFFGLISPSFKFIGEKINNLFESIGEAFANRKASRSVSRFAPIWEGIKSVFSGLGDFFEKIGPTLGKIGSWIGEYLGKIGEGIAKFTENKSAAEILEHLAKGGFFVSLMNLINSIAGINWGRKGLLDNIAEDLGQIGGVLKAYQREINVSTLLEVAMAIGVLSGSMWILAQIPSDRIRQVGKALGQLALVIAGFSALSNIFKLITSVVKKTEGLDPNTMFGKIKGIFTGMVSASIFANDASAKFLKASAAVALLAVGFKVFSKNLKIFTDGVTALGEKYTDKQFQNGLKALGYITAGLAVLSLFNGLGARRAISSLVSVVSFIVLIKTMSTLVNDISAIGENVNFTFFKSGLYMFGLLAGVVTLFTAINGIGKGKIASALGLYISVLAVMKIVDTILQSLIKLSKEGDIAKIKEAGNIVNSISRTILLFLALFVVLDKFNFKKFAGKNSLLTAAAAIVAAAGAIYLIALALEKVAGAGSPAKLSAARKALTGIGTMIAIVLGILGLISGLNIRIGNFGTFASGKFNGALGLPIAALSFVAACAGVWVIAQALSDLNDASFDFGKIEKLKSIISCVAIITGILGVAAAINVGAYGTVGAAGIAGGYFGSLGVPLAALSFAAACQGVYVMAQALAMLSNEADIDKLDVAGKVIQKLTVTIGFVLALLGVIAGFTGLGMLVGAVSFDLIVLGISGLVDVLDRFAHVDLSGLKTNLEQVADALKEFFVRAGDAIDKALELGDKVAPVAVKLGLALVVLAAGVAAIGAALIVLGIGLSAVGQGASDAGQGINDAADAFVELAGKDLSGIGKNLAIMAVALVGIGSAGLLASPGLIALGFAIETVLGPITRATEAVGDLLAAIDNLRNGGSGFEGPSAKISAGSFVSGPLGWIIRGAEYVYDAVTGAKKEAEQMGPSIAEGADKGVQEAAPKLEATGRKVDESVAKGTKDSTMAESAAYEKWLSMYSSLTSGDNMTKAKQGGYDLLSMFGSGALSFDMSSIGKMTLGDLFKTLKDGGKDAGPIGMMLATVFGDSFASYDFEAISKMSLDEIVATLSNGQIDVKTAGDLLTQTFGDQWKNFDWQKMTMDDVMKVISMSMTNSTSDLETTASSVSEAGATAMEQEALYGAAGGKNVDGYMAALWKGVELVGPAAEGLGSAVEKPLTSLNAYGWGSDLGSQYASGISASQYLVRAAASAVASIVSAFLHFSEPDVGPLSDFHTYAPDMIKLWCSGIYSNLDKVESSSNAMADSVYDGFSTALEYVSDLIDNGMSDELAIRPVMDLSGIQNGIHNMGSLISGANGYTISGTARLASTTAYGMSTRMPTAAEQAPAVAGAGVNNYNTFNITNDDPQAVAQKVSRILDQGAKREQAVWAR